MSRAKRTREAHDFSHAEMAACTVGSVRAGAVGGLGPSRGVLWLLLGASLLAAGCAGAGGRGGRSKDKISGFTQDSIAKLRPGMTVPEVIAMFGDPVRVYEARFGDATESPWKGTVYVWTGAQDPLFRTVHRHYKNCLTFFDDGSGLALHNWTLEFEKPIKK